MPENIKNPQLVNSFKSKIKFRKALTPYLLLFFLFVNTFLCCTVYFVNLFMCIITACKPSGRDT